MDQKKISTQIKTPRQPVQSRSIQTREKIINTGERMFIQQGFHNVLADDIARAAGLSVGSFYSYFKDKRALFLAILERESMEMMAGIENNLSVLLAEENPDVERAIKKLFEVLIAAHQACYPMFQQAEQMATFDDEINRYQIESDRASRQMFEKILLHIQPTLDQTRLQAVSYVLFNASEGIIHNLVTSSFNETEKEEIIRESTRLLNSYILKYVLNNKHPM
jgi:AcrR family transcriptional regulator